jgi:hypothetical protein
MVVAQASCLSPTLRPHETLRDSCQSAQGFNRLDDALGLELRADNFGAL